MFKLIRKRNLKFVYECIPLLPYLYQGGSVSLEFVGLSAVLQIY